MGRVVFVMYPIRVALLSFMIAFSRHLTHIDQTWVGFLPGGSKEVPNDIESASQSAKGESVPVKKSPEVGPLDMLFLEPPYGKNVKKNFIFSISPWNVAPSPSQVLRCKILGFFVRCRKVEHVYFCRSLMLWYRRDETHVGCSTWAYDWAAVNSIHDQLQGVCYAGAEWEMTDGWHKKIQAWVLHHTWDVKWMREKHRASARRPKVLEVAQLVSDFPCPCPFPSRRTRVNQKLWFQWACFRWLHLSHCTTFLLEYPGS